MKFSYRYILNLKPEGKIVDIREGDGFGIRVLPSGVKTFFYIYRIGGKRRFLNLGHFDQNAANGVRGTLAHAQKEYTAAKKKVQDGIDPLKEQQHAEQERLLSPSVEKLAEEYIEKYAKPRPLQGHDGKKSWQGDKRTLDVEIVPKWGKRKVKDINRRDVKSLLEEIKERPAPIMANRTRALLSKLFNFAIEEEIIEINPCMGVKHPVKEKAKARYLSADEIREVWEALSTPGVLHVSPEISRCLRLILLTGQRPGEAVGLHSSEVDGQWWTIPAERSKNGREHRVFLTATAQGLITEQIAANKTAREIPEDKDYAGYIFDSPASGKLKEDGTPREPQPIAVNALAHVVRRNIEEPKEAPEQVEQPDSERGPDTIRRKLIMPSWTPHDLRRTTATMLSELGYTDEIIDAVLNHKKKGIVATYNRNRYDREKQTALEAWERKLTSIITGKGADNVVSITTAKGARAA